MQSKQIYDNYGSQELPIQADHFFGGHAHEYARLNAGGAQARNYMNRVHRMERKLRWKRE